MTLLGQVLPIAIPVIAFFLITVVGMDLQPDDFRRVRRSPKPVLVGLLGQIILPAVAICIAHTHSLSQGVLAGLLLIASAPGGGISNYYTFLARANVALSVVWTTLSCAVAGITMPLLLKAFDYFIGNQTVFSVPLSVLMVQTFLMLVVPVLLGILIRYKLPSFVENHAGVLRKTSFLALAALILFIIYQARETFAQEGHSIVLVSGIFILLSMVCGYGLGSVFRLTDADRFTLAIEYGTRNVAIATAVAVSILKRTEFAVFGTAYFLTEVPMMLCAIAIYRKLHRWKLTSSP